MPEYQIGATPRQEVVAKGAKITYEVKLKGKEVSNQGQPNTQWFVWYSEYARKHEGAPEIYTHPQKTNRVQPFFKFTWKHLGNHKLHCVLYRGTKDVIGQAYFEQEVQSLENFLTLRKDTWQHPRQMLKFAERYRDYLLNLQEKAPATDSAALSRHYKEVEKYALYHTRLKIFLNSYQDLKDDEFLPVHARFHEKQSQETIDLNVFYVDLTYKMELVDWTDPGNAKEWGFHFAEGFQWDIEPTVIKSWKSGKEYPPGHLQYFISRNVIQGQNGTAKPKKDVKGRFETSKKSTLEKIASYLGWAGAAAAIGAVTLGVLVPGSAWVTGLIWTSLLSSSAEAVINIGVRLGQRGNHWYEDLFDGLTILGNLFAVGGMWKKGAVVMAPRQKKTLKYIFYGEILTNGFQGILITRDHYLELEALMQDGNKTPSERTEKGRALIRGWGLSMWMMVVGLHASVKELKELSQAGINSGELQKRLEQLADPKAEPIDLTKPPSVDGHTKDGKVTTKTRDVQPGHPDTPEKIPAFKDKFPKEDSKLPEKDQIWRTRKVDDPEEILLQRKCPGYEFSEYADLWFHASTKHPSGFIHVEVIQTYQDIDGKRIYTPELKAKELYPMMFKHFEDAAKKTGKPIKGIRGEFALDNYRQVNEGITKNADLITEKLASGQLILKREALTHSKTWKYWQDYLDAYGYTIKPARDVVLDPNAEMVYWMFEIFKKKKAKKK